MAPPRSGARPLRSGTAAAALLGAGLLLAGCPGGGGSPPDPADAAVRAALAARPDLAATRVFVLGLDGLDPDLLAERIGKGRCPNFKRLIEEGASGPLRSQLPTLSPLLWTSIATGQFPTEHGVLDFLVGSRSDRGTRETVTSAHRKVEAMWDIAGRYGKSVGLVGWLASHPAEEVNGFAVSERNETLAYLFHQGADESTEGKTWPPDLVERVRALRRPPSSFALAELAPFLSGVTEAEYRAACAKDEYDDELRTNDLRLVYAATENFRRVGTTLYRERAPALFCIYYEEVDAVSHFTMAYREPVTWRPRPIEEVVAAMRGVKDLPEDLVRAVAARAGDAEAPPLQVPAKAAGALAKHLPAILELARGAEPEKARRWGGAVDAAYDHADAILGEAMGLLGPDSILVVISDHGFAFGPMKPPFDSSFRSLQGGAAYHRPDGFLGLFGKGVRKGHSIPGYRPAPAAAGARLVDVCPTVLALLGFPKAEDMPGRVLSECFETDLSTGTVPTYERGRARRLAWEQVERDARRGLSGRDESTEEVELEGALAALKAVGYIGTEEEGPVRTLLHLAASYTEQGRMEEASEALREALTAAPADQARGIRLQLGQTLLRTQALHEAEGIFRALAADGGVPEPVLAWVGLALVEEARRNPAGALGHWERVVAAEPGNPVLVVRLASVLREATREGDPAHPAALGRALALLDDAARRAGGGTPDFAPLGPGGRNARGAILLDLGRTEEARAEFLAAAEAARDYVKPRNNLGVLEMRLADLDFQRAAGAPDPEGRGAPAKAGAAHRAEALRWLDEVLALDPGNAKARYNRAEIFLMFPPKDLGAAERELDAALRADPKYERARVLREEVRAARSGPGGGGTPAERR